MGLPVACSPQAGSTLMRVGQAHQLAEIRTVSQPGFASFLTPALGNLPLAPGLWGLMAIIQRHLSSVSAAD